jgi:hypothetical protein
VAAEGTFHFLFSLLLVGLRCFCVLCFVLGSLRAFGIGRFLMLEYQKSSAANTKHPQSASRFASLACFTRISCSDEVAKQRVNHFRPQTVRVVGAAGDDFWYPSMKSPPYLQPVPFPARTPDEQNNEDKQKPRHKGRGLKEVTCKQET